MYKKIIFDKGSKMGGFKENFTYQENNKKFNEYFSDKVIDSNEAKEILRRKNNDSKNIFKIGINQLKELKSIIDSNSPKTNKLTDSDLQKLEDIANQNNPFRTDEVYRTIESFGGTSTLNQKEKKFHSKFDEAVYNNNNPKNNKQAKEILQSTEKLKMITALVVAEAGGETNRSEAMTAVANVILNRMKKGKTLKQVMNKKTGYGKNEFSPMHDGRYKKIKKNLKKSDLKLMEEILTFGKNNVGNATFFQTLAADRIGNWQTRMARVGKLKETAVIGHHIFREEV